MTFNAYACVYIAILGSVYIAILGSVYIAILGSVYIAILGSMELYTKSISYIYYLDMYILYLYSVN